MRELNDSERVDRAIAWYSENRDFIVKRLRLSPWTIGGVTFLNEHSLVILDERIETRGRQRKDRPVLDEAYILRPIRMFYAGIREEGGEG